MISKEDIFSDDGFDPDLWNVGDKESAITYTSQNFEKAKEHILKDFSPRGLSISARGYEASILKVLNDAGSRADIIPVYYDIGFYYDGEWLNGSTSPVFRKDIEVGNLLNIVSFQLLEKFSSSVKITDGADCKKSARISVAWVCLTSLGFDFIKACQISKSPRKKSK